MRSKFKINTGKYSVEHKQLRTRSRGGGGEISIASNESPQLIGFSKLY